MYEVQYDSFHADGGFFVIAYDGTIPAGCGGLRPLAGRDTELKRMYVRASHRGRGVARQMLEFLEEQARRQGHTRMYLQTGRPTACRNGVVRKCGLPADRGVWRVHRRTTQSLFLQGSWIEYGRLMNLTASQNNALRFVQNLAARREATRPKRDQTDVGSEQHRGG